MLLQALTLARARTFGFVQTDGGQSLTPNCKTSGFFGDEKTICCSLDAVATTNADAISNKGCPNFPKVV